MSRLIIFDTSNFRDYPVGGQLTSVKNFLRYIGENYPQDIDKIFLIGVSTITGDVGKIQPIWSEMGQVSFLAVTERRMA